MASSSVRRVRAERQSGGAGSIGMLPIPDPRTWPDEIRVWFRNAAADCGPADIFIFNYGRLSACYLADAITCAAVCGTC